MLGLEIWGTVVGILFIYLLLSLLGTIINEWVMMLLNARGNNLRIALETMLCDGKKENKALFYAFINNPRFKKLKMWSKGSTMPSYVSSEMFVKILLDELSNGFSYKEDSIHIEQKIMGLFPEESETRRLLLSIVQECGNNLEDLETELRTWYDDVMDRASGWYKRKVKYMLLVIGMGISIIFNADTFSIVKTLSRNPEARQKVVDQAEAYLAKEALTRMEMSPQPNSVGKDTLILSPETQKALQEDETYRHKVDSLYSETRTLINDDIAGVSASLGMGWNKNTINLLFNPWYNFLLSILGWFITAFAISLGAPFWFDILMKVTNIRSSGKQITGS